MPGRRPTSTSSLPVDRTTTRGRGRTSTRSRPTAASRPTWAGPIGVPLRTASSPVRMSSPVRRTYAPGSAGRSIRTRATPPSVHSTGTIESAPDGTGAPVMIRRHSPRVTARGARDPAGMSPTTGSTTGSCSVAPGRVRGPHRVAVHRRVVEARQRRLGQHVLGAEQPLRVEQGQLDRLRHPQVGQHPPQLLVDAAELAHR